MIQLISMELPTITAPKIGVSPIQFLKEVKIELKKVKWPSQKEVVKMTTIVLSISIIVSLLITSLDFIFTKLMEILVI